MPLFLVKPGLQNLSTPLSLLPPSFRRKSSIFQFNVENKLVNARPELKLN